METKKDNTLKIKTYQFALRIIRLYQHLSQEKKEFVLSKQVLRSGTPIGALAEEANQAESKADFVHKLSIANKEANETHYWIRLLRDSGFIEESGAQSILADCEEIIKILTRIIITAKNKANKE